MILDKFVDQSNTITGGTFRPERGVLGTPDHAGDIEMRPFDARLHKSLDELRSGNRSTFARADILHIGNLAIDQLVVGIAEREAARNRIAALNVGVNDAESRRIADEILKDVPDNVDALMMRAAYRIQDSRFRDAVADLRAVLARQPRSTETLLMLARTHVFSNESNLAKDNYRKLLEIEPGNADALRELGALLGGSGQTREAESLLREALRGDPKDTTASQSLVAALLQQKDFDAAASEAARMAGAGDQSGIAEYQQGLALAAQRSRRRRLGTRRGRSTSRRAQRECSRAAAKRRSCARPSTPGSFGSS